LSQYCHVSYCFRVTGGTEKQRSLAHSFYSGAHGVFIVYAITDLNSSFKLDGWIKDVENVCNYIIIKLNLLLIFVIIVGESKSEL